MKYIYGPLKSRRLGFSLGINLTPYKICNFNCIYCQLGRTQIQAAERKEYLPLAEILSELKCWLSENSARLKELSYLTISGSGEPTLNIRIGDLIQEIKNITALPVAIMTNSSLLKGPALRRELLPADLIIPSLDAAENKAFARINRPLNGVKIEEIIQGLIALRKEFKGKIWLEVMLVAGINDDLRHIKKLKAAIDQINPDKVQLNSPVRATSEPNILAISKSKLKKIKEIIGDNCEIL